MTPPRRYNIGPVIRSDPFHRVIHIDRDITGATFSFSVGHPYDPIEGPVDFTTPGTALKTVGMTTTLGAEGIRIIDVAERLIEIVLIKNSVEALPASPTGRATVRLSYDLQWTPAVGIGGAAPLEETIAYGDFVILESFNA